MNYISNSATNSPSDQHQFELVPVRDNENREHLFKVSGNLEFIGGGIRGGVRRVCEEAHGLMAMKQYPVKRMHELSGGADLAMSGHKALQRILPADEHELLVQPLYVDSANQRLFAPLLNREQWVVGTAQNSSKDRDALQKNKLLDVQGFDQSVSRLFDALEHVGKNGFVLCADVYFFTINHSHRKFGYLYGDYEAIHDEREPVDPNHIAPSNLIGAAISLHAFLHECVQDPEIYLKFLYREVMRRLNAYKEIDRDIDETIAILEEKKWPEPNWREMAQGAALSVGKWLVERWKTFDKD